MRLRTRPELRLGRLLALLALLAGCHTTTAQAPLAPQPPAAPAGVDLSLLDRATDPCADFYQYACGGWLARTEIPPDRPTWSRGFSEVEARNQGLLRTLLEGYARGEHLDELPEARKLGDFYASCMDEPALNAAGLAPLDAELARLQVRDAESLERAVAHLQGEGVSALFSLGVEPDRQDPTQTIAVVGQGGLGLPDPSFYLREDAKLQAVREAYIDHVARMLELSGISADAARSQAYAVFAVEKALAEGALSRAQRADPQATYHRLDLDGLQRLAPHFDWAALLVDLGQPNLRAIDVAEPGYFQRLDAVLQQTPPASLAAYLRWRLLHGLAAALPVAFGAQDFAFSGKLLTGMVQDEPRWKRCVAETDRVLGPPLAHAFVLHAFPPESKAAAAALAQQLEAELGQAIDASAWMDGPTRAAAREKLAALSNQVGYPATWPSYQGLAVDRGGFLRNELAGRAFEVQRALARVGQPVDPAAWDVSPAQVAAAYDDARNALTFPAGILQPPFFSPGAAAAVNAGGAGVLMGHELSHGFDETGRYTDARGAPRDAWSPQSAAAFAQRAACVKAQFDAYPAVEGEHVDGALTLTEDLADLAGTRLAFAAMQAEQARHPDPPSSLTAAQAFFLGQAQAWCRKDRSAYARLLLAVDPHAPAKWRVNGPLSNLPGFAQAWHCPAGAPMVRPPAQRCEVW